MKKRKCEFGKVFGALLIVFYANFASSADKSFTNSQQIDLYWVSYRASSPEFGEPIQLMQIDQFGKHRLVRDSRIIFMAKHDRKDERIAELPSSRIEASEEEPRAYGNQAGVQSGRSCQK
jgi:hypothetical protein